MKSLILASIITLSMIGIVGIDESFAGEPALNMRLIDEFGNSMHNAYVNQEIYISYDLANKQNNIQPFIFLIQIKDDTNTVVHLSWLSDSLSAGEISSLLLSWTPTESGTYTVTGYVWESFDRIIPLKDQVYMKIIVQGDQS
jgi:hypothetical protein